MARPKFIPGEREGVAIRRCKAISAELSKLALETCLLLHEMERELHELARADNDPEIRQMIERCQELSRLENRQELQSWQITVDRVMTEAWRRLP